MNKLNIPEKIGVIDPKDIICEKRGYEVELYNSISVNGIKKLPTIKDNRSLVIGNKRVVIAQKLYDSIEVRIIASDLEPYQYELLSHFDNLSKDNIHWSEKAILQARVHEIYKEENFKHKQSDTAEILHCSNALLSENITLSEAISFDPTIALIQDRATALKQVQKAGKRSFQEKSLNPKENNLLFGDVIKELSAFNDKEFDVCILYGDIEDYSSYFEIYRVLKNNSFIYIFADKSEIQRETLRAIGFSVQNYPLIWAKEELPCAITTWQYSKNYEFITVGVKGSPALLLDIVSSLNYSSKKGMIKRLLEVSSYESSNILNPFAIDSLVAEACNETKRNYTLICNNLDLFNDIKGRL